MDHHEHEANRGSPGGGGDDSDNDVVTDFLNSNTTDTTTVKSGIGAGGAGCTNNISGHQVAVSPPPATSTLPKSCMQNKTVESQNYCIPIINAPLPPPTATTNNCNSHNNNNINNNNNMIPIINVTPHSPAAANKYQNIFEDTLIQLQNIRESVVQMKNSSAHMHSNYFPNYGLLQAAILSASLPDLNAGDNRPGGAVGGVSAAGAAPYMRSPHQYLLSTDRRRSWTTIDDLTGGGGADCTNKSVSLSSLDSEEQETIRVTEQRRRATRNSTGGISTHSLNEAELARDFERIVTTRNLATEIMSRIPLQKSISTSSIIANKDDIKAIQRHLTDSEDENQSLLRAHTKIEVYDHVEKRRKRGSLFFRKKKDKVKAKSAPGGAASSSSPSCDVCGAPPNGEHQLECKSGRKAIGPKLSLGGGGGGGAKRDNAANHQHDYCDGVDCAADDTPLIRSEFLNDPPIEAGDLGADPALGITLDEFDSWSPSVPKSILKPLKEKQIKRQEHIYEFIMTEKHHCQTLLVMQKVFVESLERHFPTLHVNRMFPRLAELSELHIAFLRQLRQKQREHYVVDSIADILLEFFSLEQAQHLRLAYGEFCANHRSALEQFKACLTGRDPSFAEWYKHCLANPLLKKKGIPECILFVTQRLTKYPLLIEPLVKSARDDKLETDKLQHALALVKALLFDVDACVAEKELRERQIEIGNRIDAKSFAIYKHKPFRKLEVGVESRRRLKFEGLATLMQGRSKMQLVLVVVLTDCLCFLSENSAHNKYTFFTPEHKAGVVPLQKLLIREKAGTESRGIYIISSNPAFPEMYELKVQQPKDKNVWIQSIRQAVLECPSTDVLLEADNLTAEEKLRIGVNKRELIEKIRQKDIEQALLLEEKIVLQLSLLKEQPKKPYDENAAGSGDASGSIATISAATFLSALGSYKDLVSVDCDTAELWKRVLSTVQDIGQLAAAVYNAAMGLPVSRSVSSVGERQSDSYASPTLPKRAETFAGFDERRASKGAAAAAVTLFPCRGGGADCMPRAPPPQSMLMLTPRLQQLEEERRGGSDSKATARQPHNPTPIDQAAPGEPIDSEPIAIKEHNYAALQISHHLQTLLCIISQQMTAVHSLQLQLALYRETPPRAAAYTHNDQLEELRNLQDRLQDEKTAWLRKRDQEEQELEERRAQQLKLRDEIRAEQADIRQQREQLYRKMELLSSQGLLLSPNTPLMVAVCPTPPPPPSAPHDEASDASDGHHQLHGGASEAPTPDAATPLNTVDRRKWRSASTISKTPPVNLLSATNAPKVNVASVKQKIPIKLSSLSSTASAGTAASVAATNGGNGSKIDKSASFNSANSTTANSPIVGLTQMFPLKLADRRATTQQQQHQTQQQLLPQHSRTGSSPAIIQHPASSTAAAGAMSPPLARVTRTDSLSAFSFGQQQQQQQQQPRHATAKPTAAQTHKSAKSTTTTTRQTNNVRAQAEEEIYF